MKIQQQLHLAAQEDIQSRKLQNETAHKLKIEELRQKLPRFAQLEDELASLGLDLVKTALASDGGEKAAEIRESLLCALP